MAQILITLPDGQQVAIVTTTDIDSDNTGVKVRESPGSCWSPDLDVKNAHEPDGIHFGSW